MNIICCSGGNDSVTLIRWAKLTELKNVIVLYNDTGWAITWWKNRMREIRTLCCQYGFKYSVTKSIGFKNLVKKQKGISNGCKQHVFLF